MSRYLAYSTFIHAAGIAIFLFMANLSTKPTAYYGFQFLGGQSGFGTGRLEPAPAPALTKEAGKSVGSTPKEDVLPKSDDADRVAIAKKSESKKEGPKGSKNQEKSLAKKAGEKGGHGQSRASLVGRAGV